MILLQVQVGHLESDDDLRLRRRFGRFFKPETGEVQYPVSLDTHGFDVFHDELEGRVQVDYAAIIELPHDNTDFEPFTEESAGWVLASYEAEPGAGWRAERP